MLLISQAPADTSRSLQAVSDLRCGGYCLYVGLNALDFNVGTYSQFEERLGQPSPVGYSLETLAEVARSFGAHAQGFETTLDRLSQRKGTFVTIALVDDNHFVNIYDIKNGIIYVSDPPTTKEIPLNSFESIWNSKVLIIAKEPIQIDGGSYGRMALFSTLTLTVLASLIIIFRGRKKNASN